MTSGRLTFVSSSSSARSRAAPSAVSASAATTGAAAGRARWQRRAAARRTGARRRPSLAASASWQPVALRRGRLAVRPLGVAVGHLDHDVGWPGPAASGSAQERARSARSPCARRSGAAGWRTAGRPRGRAARPGPSAGTAVGEGREQRVLVLLRGVGRRPPDPDAVERPERLEPVAARIRPPVAELGPARSPRPAGRSRHRWRRRRATVCDGSQNAASRRGESLRRRPLAVEAQAVHALDPLADPGQLDRRGRQRCGQLDDEDAWALRGHGPAPHGRAVRHQADGAEQGGGVGVVGSSLDGTGDGLALWCARHVRSRSDRSEPPSARLRAIAIVLAVAVVGGWLALPRPDAVDAVRRPGGRSPPWRSGSRGIPARRTRRLRPR